MAAQHELDKQEWQAEMGRQQEAHDKAMGEVRSCRHSACAQHDRAASKLHSICMKAAGDAGWIDAQPVHPPHLPLCPAPSLFTIPLCSHCAPQVRAELAATQEELRQAQLAIQERDYAIATQQRCEAALAGHAGGWDEAASERAMCVAAPSLDCALCGLSQVKPGSSGIVCAQLMQC